MPPDSEKEKMISNSKPTKETAFKVHGIKSKSSPDILEKYSKPLRTAGKEFMFSLDWYNDDVDLDNLISPINGRNVYQ